MTTLLIITTLLSAIVAVTGIVLLIRGFRPIVIDYTWAVKAAAWVWGKAAVILLITLTSCKKDCPEPPKKFPHDLRDWNDWVDPEGKVEKVEGVKY